MRIVSFEPLIGKVAEANGTGIDRTIVGGRVKGGDTLLRSLSKERVGSRNG
jgi:protein gp37